MKNISLTLWLLVAFVTLSSSVSVGQSDLGGVPYRGSRKSSGVHPAQQPAGDRQTWSGAMPLGVRRGVPQDYALIQAAINACSDGDTVLVSEGTYLENIRYSGKAIIVASLFLIDGDTTHIDRTIIDGSDPSHPDSGSVVYFVSGEDTNSVLCGFTVTGGTGTRFIDGGIWYRVGGGVLCNFAGARIVKNRITRNRVVGASAAGAGIAAEYSGSRYLILEGNSISDNFLRADSVGTWGYSGGADIWDASARIVGNVFERDTVVGANLAVGGGLTFYSGDLHPQYRAYIQGNIFRANIVQGNISGAVGAGMCIASTGGDVTIVENLIEGNVATSTSGWAQGSGIVVDDQNTAGWDRKIIAHNRILGNRASHGGGSSVCGAGMYLLYTMATLDGNEIADNSANGTGGGVAAAGSSFRLQNNIIARNSTTTSGGGLDIAGSAESGTEQLIMNNTIVDNHAANVGGGMEIRSGNRADVVTINNIFWGNTAPEGSEISVGTGSAATVQYCDVQGGWPGLGNINADPLFILPRLDSLNTSSPCISAGAPTNAPATDYHGHPRPQPAGSRPDIGAEESPAGRVQTIGVTPGAVNFGSIPVGHESDTITVALRNISLQPLIIDSIVLHQSEFSLVDLPALPVTLVPSDSILFRVFFRPAAPGVTYGEICVTNHDALAPGTSVLLQGSGLLYGAQFQWFIDRVTAAPAPDRSAIVDSFWAAHPVMPLIEQDSICQFLYRGYMSSVNLPCDANGWSTSSWPLARLSSTNLWYRVEVFPVDNHLEYKFYLNGTTWTADPRNPRTIGQYGNSDLWMPGYVRPPEILYYPNIPHGTLRDTTFYSAQLGNSRTIRVYLPPGYNPAESCAVVVVHDGLNYILDGYANNVLDYLLSQNRIQRAIGVFVPPVNRDAEYVGGSQNQFAAFIATELMPYIDARYHTQHRPSSRATLGGSNGGNIALWIAYNYPQVFGNAGSYSGNIMSSTSSAFQTDSLRALKLYVDVGTRDMPGFLELSRDFRQIIQSRGYDYRYNEWFYGYHSMATSREHLDNALEFFIPGSAMSVDEKQETPMSFTLQQNYPNPFNPSTTISFTIPPGTYGRTSLQVYDLLGREVATLLNEEKSAGAYTVQWDAGGVSSGVYFYRLRAGDFVQTRKMLLMR
jgi:enterochelin esterase-like enzyme